MREIKEVERFKTQTAFEDAMFKYKDTDYLFTVSNMGFYETVVVYRLMEIDE